jgi:hypothetical protein
MTDIPIIFSGPMVRALLDGRKTMTRRLAWRKRREVAERDRAALERRGHLFGRSGSGDVCYASAPSPWQKAAPGDRLYVRENFALHDKASDVCTVVYAATINRGWTETVEQFPVHLAKDIAAKPYQEGWRPSIHHPRAFSRITLVVTATKVEPIQRINGIDAEAEGITRVEGEAPWRTFKHLWESLHGHEGWDSNPEVVALTFTVHKVNIDKLTPTSTPEERRKL